MSFKICTVGCGNQSIHVHGPSYRKYADENPGVELAACCDINEEKASAYQQKFGFKRYYTDIVEMLDAEKPDAVCLVAPEALTAELSVRILKHGYPLLMEKPPGITCDETMEMIKAAEEHNTANQVAFNRRYVPLVRKLKELLSENLHEPGEIHNIQYSFYRVNRRDADFSTTAIHAIDTVKYIAGSDYSHVRFSYQEFPEIGPNVANIFMDCTFSSGATAQIAFCPVSGIVMERAVVNGYGHTFFLELPMWRGIDSPGRMLHIQGSRTISSITGNDVNKGTEMIDTDGFYPENASFFDDLRNDRRPEGDLKTALQSVQLAQCIRERKAGYINAQLSKSGS